MIMNGDRVDAMDSSRDGGMCCNRLLRLCILCFWFVLTQWSWMRTDHTRPDPSALILSVKFCNQETGTNLHTQERNERFSTLQLLASSVWHHLSPSCFVTFLLAPNLSLPELVLMRMYTLWRCLAIQGRTNGPKRHGLTHPHCPPSHHHDEWSLLLWWMWEQTH
jgi:hypothetical protein